MKQMWATHRHLKTFVMLIYKINHSILNLVLKTVPFVIAYGFW